MTQVPSVAIIIVTYNSQLHMPKMIGCLQKQTHPASQVIIVDTGSEDLSYHQAYCHQAGYQLIQAEKNSGFCRGNNVGMEALDPSVDYVFFLNPDAFLTPTFLEKAVAFMEQPENARCGALTGTTLGYDIVEDKPTGLYDTTGVFQKWFGKWFDRGQGERFEAAKFAKTEAIPAICGAVFFTRYRALKEVLIHSKAVFDPTFYMYKEDIDLSVRLRKKGWKLLFVPQLIAYHCRGWNADRKKMPRRMRLASAKNEWTIHWRARQPLAAAYSFAKYSAVKVFDL